jgi:RNA-directed DNA polymerase
MCIMNETVHNCISNRWISDDLMPVAQYLRVWMNYFGISEYYIPVDGIDGWIRRRFRMCYWKRWRYVTTRVRNLLNLKTSRSHALATGSSRKGYWRLSKSLGTQTGMTNQWIGKQGLISVKELWVNIHYPTTVR